MHSYSTVLSDEEHFNLSFYSAEMLLAYRCKMKKLEKLYRLEKIDFPNPCRTNFRDTWFHYKKVYERFDSIKVHQEQYAMEEHLIRILKDAYIVLFNEYARRIENVYLLLLNRQKVLDRLNESRGEEYYSQYEDIKIDMDFWYVSVDDRYNIINNLVQPVEYTNLDIAAITDIDLHLFLTQADIGCYKKMLQKYMHKIKNCSLRLRLQGVEIFRPENMDDYLEDFIDVFGEIKKTLEKYRIKAVLRRFSYYYENKKEIYACT